MSRLRGLRPSRATVIAVVALIVALGGTNAYATAAAFMLNVSNTSTDATTLDGSAVAGKALQITNTNTGTGSTALGLTVAAGHTPFTVSSAAKVVRLNADKLDGIDSTGFTKGTGHFYSNRGGAVEASTPNVDQALVIPNLGELDIYCGTTGYAVKFLNSSGVLLDVVSAVGQAPDSMPPGTSSDPHLSRQLLANASNATLVASATGLVDGTVTVGKDTGPTQLLATIHFTGEIDSNICTSQAQGWTT